jgi:fibronectin type 3 domain-containing protein
LPFFYEKGVKTMAKKFSLFAVVLILLQVFLPLSNVFAVEMQTPANLKANQYYPGNILLDWDKVTGASNYKIYKIVDGQQEFVKQVTYEYTDTTVYNVSEGSSTFAVTAVRNSDESELSNIVTVEVVYPEMENPLKVVSTIANGNDLTLSWDKATYATDYNIYQVVNGSRTLAATTKSSSYTFVNHS